MLEFKDYKIETKKDLLSVPIKFIFVDDELTEESIENVKDKIKEYEIYLEYDCKGEFKFEYKKKFTIEMIIMFPGRKVPEDKKELQNFVNRYVMDFTEYYHKIDLFDNVADGNLPLHT
ncbi:MAG: hypothetical protein ACPK7O_06165 [Methanobacterium sp.]